MFRLCVTYLPVTLLQFGSLVGGELLPWVLFFSLVVLHDNSPPSVTKVANNTVDCFNQLCCSSSNSATCLWPKSLPFQLD